MGRNDGFTINDTLQVKGIAIVMMLFHHLFGFPDRIPQGITLIDVQIKGQMLSYYVAVFCKLCVAVFVFLGGVGTYYSFRNDQKEIKKAFTKIFRLYKTYWIVFAVFVPVGFALGTQRFDITTFIKSAMGISHAYCAEWWFFLPYIVVALQYAIMCRWFEKTHNILIELTFIVAVFLCSKYVIQELPSEFRSFLPISVFLSGTDFLPGFLLGAFFAKHDILGNVKKKILQWPKLYILPISIVMIVCVFCLRQKIGDVYDSFLASLFVLITAILLWMLPKRCTRVLVELGNYSMVMWLCHTFYCYQFIPRTLYSLRAPLVILLALVGMSFFSSVALQSVSKILYNLIKKQS